MGYIEDYAG
uniref:Uncharacterized protein n=1 Tax=Arundo donax TaxID=35708 RepID=A0A0A9FYD6_ARUDO